MSATPAAIRIPPGRDCKSPKILRRSSIKKPKALPKKITDAIKALKKRNKSGANTLPGLDVDLESAVEWNSKIQIQLDFTQ